MYFIRIRFLELFFNVFDLRVVCSISLPSGSPPKLENWLCVCRVRDVFTCPVLGVVGTGGVCT